MTLASPESTGHAGPFFEGHVDAAFLALLLVRGTPPFLLRAEVSEVHFQASHMGWATDDILVVGRGSDGEQYRAAISVKRTFTMAKTDTECVDVFTKAWSDFKSSKFVTGRDTLALITRPSSAKMAHALRVLLETARASVDGADFMRRMALPKYRDQHARSYAATIREIVADAYQCTVTDDDLKRFLDAFDFACLDLNTPSSSTEALLLSLLRTCAVPGSSSAIGADVWKELVTLVSGDAPAAKSYQWNDLPETLRERFSLGNTYLGRLLEPFGDMTRTVCDGVDTSVGGHHEPRTNLEQQALDQLDVGRVLLIGGLAGSGKSAVAKAVFESASRGRFALAVRAEMLARPSVGETLVAMGTSFQKLREAMALHPYKVLWIDGAERLLEKSRSEREAFYDVLRLVRSDPTWRIMITCRAYSLETLKASFLDWLEIESTVLTVPTLESGELDAFAAHSPQLARPLSSPQLRVLLSNLFFLKMATRMRWDAATPLPLSEREFRAQVWKQVIRRDDESLDGMPLKRDATYMQVALRRAHSLDAFVDVADLDKGAVAKLQADTLLVEGDAPHGRFAPSHDVLEDWALLEWFDREYERTGRSWPPLIAALGAHPAIRRTFRTWLTERIECDPAALKSATALITDATLPRHWTDDALVAVLRSRDPQPFLAAHARALLDESAHLLRRAVHLARVACQQPLTGSPEEIAAEAQRPVGLAWQRLAEFIAEHIGDIVPHCAPLLLRFLEDWCKCVTWNDPYPAGSEAIAAITLRLLDDVDVHAYSRDADTTRLIKVLFHIPRHAEERIRTIARECLAERFREEEPFVALALHVLHGVRLCRDLPDVVISFTHRMLAPPQESSGDDYSYGHRETLAERFGLDDGLEHFGHPASAFHGPFLNLLRLHVGDGLALIINAINRCSDAYLASVEDTSAWTFELPDGSTVVHRGDGRLWSMYRVNSGPDVLRSMLMALEARLLDLGDRGDFESVRTIVAHVMANATSVALSSVVASVVMAFPDALGDFALPFLRTRGIFIFDRARCIGDLTPTDRIFADAFPATTNDTWLYNRERVISGERQHRRLNLELLAELLQSSRWRDSVLQVLDDHDAALPEEAQQDDEDRYWRLALHRMDTRNVQMRSDEDGRGRLHITPPPADVQAVVDRERPAIEATRRATSILLWGQSCCERKNDAAYPASIWRQQLEWVRTHEPAPLYDARLVVAVVCLRDHRPELTDDEHAWCAELVCAAFSPAASSAGPLGMGALSGSHEAALELAGILTSSVAPHHKAQLEEALTRALLSSDEEISKRAAAGIGRDLWKADPVLARCLATALFEYTQREFDLSMSERRVFPALRDPEQAEASREHLKKEAVDSVTKRHVDLGPVLAADFRKSPARFVLHELSEIFLFQSSDPDAQAFVTSLTNQLRASWEAERIGHSRRDSRESFDYQTSVFVTDVVCVFALRLDEDKATALLSPLRAVAHTHTKEVARLARRLALKECDWFEPQVFWPLWAFLGSALIERANATPKLHDSVLDAIAEALFRGLHWKETTSSWRSLPGHEEDVAEAFSLLRTSVSSIERFAQFLSTIGGKLFPDVLPLLAKKLTERGARLSEAALPLFEKSLGNLVYTGAPRIRHEPNLREATLVILGVLIEAGSSKAYRMRDDFVTPLRVEAAQEAS